MGYTYISPEKALEMRDGLLTRFVLTDILEDQLSKSTESNTKEKPCPFPNRPSAEPLTIFSSSRMRGW
jgi:hypothetical protein